MTHCLTLLALTALLACSSGAAPIAPPGPDRQDATGDVTNMTKPKTPAAPDAGTGDLAGLARKLLDLGFRELFLRMDEDQVDALWRTSAAQLAQLVRDTGQDPQARFLAAEILFRKQPGFPGPDLRPVLAPLYAEAMAQTGQPTGPWRLRVNQWGFLYHNDDVGPVGRHLLALGRDAVPALRPLLDDRDRVRYEGSQEATLGNSLQYRVNDLAAYYIGRLISHPVAFHRDFTARDAEIQRLIQTLP